MLRNAVFIIRVSKSILLFLFIMVLAVPSFAQVVQGKELPFGKSGYETAYSKYVSLTKDLPFLAWRRTER